MWHACCKMAQTLVRVALACVLQGSSAFQFCQSGQMALLQQAQQYGRVFGVCLVRSSQARCDITPSFAHGWAGALLTSAVMGGYGFDYSRKSVKASNFQDGSKLMLIADVCH